MMLNKEKLKMWHALGANFLFVLNGVRKNTPGNIASGKLPQEICPPKSTPRKNAPRKIASKIASTPQRKRMKIDLGKNCVLGET